MPATAPTDAVTDPLAGLNDSQRAAATTLSGPVCILAGAGTGKTTTVTARIAWQVLSGAHDPREVLAVTFTRKAAGELRERLARHGVRGVEARTFHAAAGWMLRFLWAEYTGRDLPMLAPSKYPLVAPLVRRLPGHYRYRPSRDVVSAIEWGSNRMVPPAELCDRLEAAGIEPPLPADLMARVAEGYAQAKEQAGCIDYEDMLVMCADLLEQHDHARQRIQGRFRTFTVDEYQDVNPLQQRLLDAWLGDRDDICVVGDDHQTIYSFTGARASYLTGFAQRFPHATTVTLTTNYRSTGAVLGLANDLARRLQGTDKRLEPTAPGGPEPQVHPCQGSDDEARRIARRCVELHAEGVPAAEMAVLYRTNDQSTGYEQALVRAGLPVHVRGKGLLERDAFQQLSRMVRQGSAGHGGLGEAVEAAATRLGWEPDGDGSGGQDEQVRQRDLATLVAAAGELAGQDPIADAATFLAAMQERFGHADDHSGVQLMSIHAAKGLEYDAVFLPALNEGVLPHARGRQRAPVEEEKRLLFVGITRARRHLWLSWDDTARKGPSSFLVELGLVRAPSARERSRASRTRTDPTEGMSPADAQLFEDLRRWRSVAADDQPAYVVFSNRTLAEIATRRPASSDELLSCSGVGQEKLARYGADVLATVRAASS